VCVGRTCVVRLTAPSLSRPHRGRGRTLTSSGKRHCACTATSSAPPATSRGRSSCPRSPPRCLGRPLFSQHAGSTPPGRCAVPCSQPRCRALLCRQDKDGVVWRDKLIASARKEFEDARHERDPDIIARLLIGTATLDAQWPRLPDCAARVRARAHATRTNTCNTQHACLWLCRGTGSPDRHHRSHAPQGAQARRRRGQGSIHARQRLGRRCKWCVHTNTAEFCVCVCARERSHAHVWMRLWRENSFPYARAHALASSWCSFRSHSIWRVLYI